jgi:hypothetical protein
VASKKRNGGGNGKGEDTEATLGDVVRAIQSLGDGIDSLETKLTDVIKKNHRAVMTVLRNHEARISKLERR